MNKQEALDAMTAAEQKRLTGKRGGTPDIANAHRDADEILCKRLETLGDTELAARHRALDKYHELAARHRALDKYHE